MRRISWHCCALIMRPDLKHGFYVPTFRQGFQNAWYHVLNDKEQYYEVKTKQDARS